MPRSTSGLLILLAVSACVPPEGSATGRVTWAGTAEGEGIVVTVTGPVTRAAVTDLEGNWSFAQLPPGAYAVLAEAEGTLEGRVSTQLTVTDRHRAEAEPLTFTRVGAIAGVVTKEDGTDHSGISVMVVGAPGTAVTAADGSFVLEGVPTGVRDFVAFASGYEKQTRTGVEVHRGQTAQAVPLSLTPILPADGPRTGTLEGRAWMPGTDDHSGIEVRVTGTALTTTTEADGTFRLPGVPSGVVGLTFTRGDANVELPRVLVVAGGRGFIIDKGLYDLGLKPIPLRRGKRLLDATASVVALSPNGTWTALSTTSPARLWLYGPDAVPRQVATDLPINATYGFSGAAYWHMAYDQRNNEYALMRTAVPELTTTRVVTLPNLIDVRVAVTPNGVAWTSRRTLNLKASPDADPVQKFTNEAGAVLAFKDDSVLVAASKGVHEVALDGTVRWSLNVTTGADWFLVSPDKRWLAVGTGGVQGKPVSGIVTLVDRTLSKQQTLPATCYSPSFSPDSDAVLCETYLHRLSADGTFTTQWVGPRFSTGPSVWLGNGRVLVGTPPEVRIVSPTEPDVVITGFSYDSTLLVLSPDRSRVRLLAHVDPISGLGQALELELATSAFRVLADGVSSRPFLANQRGVLVGRPRSVGTDLDLFFVPDTGSEVALGRSAKAYGSYLSLSAASTFIGARRFAPGRGYESVVVDTRAPAAPVVPVSLAFAYDRWLDDHRLVQSIAYTAPFTDLTGLYLLELP